MNMFDRFKVLYRVFLTMTVLTALSSLVILLTHNYIGINLQGSFVITLSFLCLLFSIPSIFAGLTVLTKALEKALMNQDIQLALQKQQMTGKKK